MFPRFGGRTPRAVCKSRNSWIAVRSDDESNQPVSTPRATPDGGGIFRPYLHGDGGGHWPVAMLEAVRENGGDVRGSGWRWWSTRSMARSPGGSMSCLQPNWSGEVLDLVVDFVTQLCRPMRSLPVHVVAGHGAVAGAGIGYRARCIADRRMKTDDNHFRGFPALWNAAAFYLFLLHPRPWLASLMVAVLIMLTLCPSMMHPVRVEAARPDVSLMAIWAVLAISRWPGF
jgi:phosphatidylcholine synthase